MRNYRALVRRQKKSGKDVWDRVEVVGKILITPVLVGLIAVLVANFQEKFAKQERQLELALKIAAEPVYLTGDASILYARKWARKTIEERFGSDIPAGALTATTSRQIVPIGPSKTLFTRIASGEIALEDVLADPRFENCPDDKLIVLECMRIILGVIDRAGEIVRQESGRLGGVHIYNDRTIVKSNPGNAQTSRRLNDGIP